MAATGDELVTLSQLKSAMGGQLDLTEDSVLVKDGSNVLELGLVNEGAGYVVIGLQSEDFWFRLYLESTSFVPLYDTSGQTSPLFLDPLSSTYAGDIYSYLNIIIPV